MSVLRVSTLLAVVALGLSGCGGSSEHESGARDGAPKKVSVATVQRQSGSAVQKIMGTVAARNHADIETKVQARVERIPVALGSQVRAGDVLAELDIREANARVQQARAVYEQATQDLARFETLLGQQAATQQEYDGIKARQAVAAGSLQEAEALLSYARIVAPFDGVVTAKMIDIGDLAVPGRPLFSVDETGSPRLVVTIPESQLASIAVGRTMMVEIPAADTTVAGRVEELSSSADPASRGFAAKVELPADPRIRPGFFGRLLLPTGGAESLFIPLSAIVKRGQLDLVYVVTDKSRAALRLVRVGRQTADAVEILAGLREGEKVIVSGQLDLAEGDLVEEQS